MREWSAVMIERMKELKPLVACFNGKGIYEVFSGKKDFQFGKQPEMFPHSETVSIILCDDPMGSYVVKPCNNTSC